MYYHHYLFITIYFYSLGNRLIELLHDNSGMMHRDDFYDDANSSSIILQRIVTHKKLYRRCLQNSRINIINNVNSFKNQHYNHQQQHNGDKSSAVRTNNNNNINNHKIDVNNDDENNYDTEMNNNYKKND